jgi:hypothetical protein
MRPAKIQIQSEAEKRYYENTIDRATYAVLAKPSVRGAVGLGEVRHLWRVGTTHHSGEPREDIVVPRVRGGGVNSPMGSPEHGSPKRRATSSKFTTISP